METNLLDRMLNAYQNDQIPVTVTLQNKVRVSGKIKAFDSYVIVVDGQKNEILYRHAVSSLSPFVQEEQKRQPAPPAPAKPAMATKPAPRPQKNITQKPRPQHQSAPSTASGDASLNNSMKDGLLKWMQEQKAAK